MLEKRAKREMEAVYQRNKVEQEKELERKKKEFNQNLTKKNYTFEYDGGIMYLKPFRDDNLAVNEITEVVVNAKKNLKVNNPTEVEPRVRTAEVIEKEGPLQSSRGGGPPDEKVRKPKVVGMFKPAPHVYEVIQVVGGVTFSAGKNLVKKGQPAKADGKLKYDEFRQKHLGIEPPKEDSDARRQREKEQKEAKEKKYRRTIDNWKEELKKGLKPHLNFDPDLLIHLIMTDDMEGDQQKKVLRRAEREKKVQTVVELKVSAIQQKKLAEIVKNPEKFLNRVVNYKPIEEGAANSAQKKPVVDPQLITEFQKAISQFNDGLVGAKKEEDLYQMPNSEMDAKLYKFTKPQQFSHQPVSELQVR